MGSNDIVKVIGDAASSFPNLAEQMIAVIQSVNRVKEKQVSTINAKFDALSQLATEMSKFVNHDSVKSITSNNTKTVISNIKTLTDTITTELNTLPADSIATLQQQVNGLIGPTKGIINKLKSVDEAVFGLDYEIGDDGKPDKTKPRTINSFVKSNTNTNILAIFDNAKGLLNIVREHGIDTTLFEDTEVTDNNGNVTTRKSLSGQMQLIGNGVKAIFNKIKALNDNIYSLDVLTFEAFDSSKNIDIVFNNASSLFNTVQTFINGVNENYKLTSDYKTDKNENVIFDDKGKPVSAKNSLGDNLVSASIGVKSIVGGIIKINTELKKLNIDKDGKVIEYTDVTSTIDTIKTTVFTGTGSLITATQEFQNETKKYETLFATEKDGDREVFAKDSLPGVLNNYANRVKAIATGALGINRALSTLTHTRDESGNLVPIQLTDVGVVCKNIQDIFENATLIVSEIQTQSKSLIDSFKDVSVDTIIENLIGVENWDKMSDEEKNQYGRIETENGSKRLKNGYLDLGGKGILGFIKAIIGAVVKIDKEMDKLSQIELINGNQIDKQLIKHKAVINLTFKRIKELFHLIIKHTKELNDGIPLSEQAENIKAIAEATTAVNSILKNLAQINKLVEDITKIKLINPIKFIINLRTLIRQFNYIYKEIYKLIQRLQLTEEKLKEFEKNSKFIDTICKFFDKVPELFNKIKLGSIISTLITIKLSLILLQEIIKKIIKSLVSICELLIKSNINKSIKDAIDTANEINKFIESLKSIIRSLLWLAVLSIALILASPIIVLGLLTLLIVSGALALALKTLVFIFKFIRLKDIAAIGLIILALVLVVSAFLVLAVVLISIAKINEEIVWSDVFEFLLMVLALLAIFVVVGAVLSYMGIYILPLVAVIVITILTMVVIVGAILLLAVFLWSLTKIKLDKDAIMDSVKTIMDTAIGVIAAVFEGFAGDETDKKGKSKSWFGSIIGFVGGVATSLIKTILSVYALALSLVAIGIILFIALKLRLLQEISLDRNTIKTNVQIVIGTAMMVVDMIFDRRDEKADDPSTKGFIPTLIEFFTPGPMIAIMGAIMAIGFLAISLVAISLILGIAANLKLIEKLNLNTNAVTSSVTACIDTALFVIDKVFSKDTHKEEKSSGVIESLLEFTMGKGMKNIIKALVAVGFLACAQAAIGMVSKIAKDLNELHKLPNLNGVQNKASVVIKASQTVINTVFSGAGDEIKKALKAEQYIKVVSRMISTLNKMAPQMVELVNYTNKLGQSGNEQQIKDALQSVLTTHINFLNDVSNLRLSHDLSENIKTVIQEVYKLTTAKFDEKKIGETLKNYSDFLKVVDNIDIENLKTAARMVEKMADFSQSINGNFEQLAETLNEKIAPLLEELKEAMDKVSTKVEESGASISTSVHESGRSDLTEDELKNQVKRENPKATAEEISKLVVKRLKEQVESNSKKGDMEDVINILTNIGVKIKKS